MALIRTFIAAPLPDEVKAALAALIGGMAPRWPDRSVRWVGKDTMHLTLRFLGDTDEALVPDLSADLDRIAGRAPPFALRLAGAGCFPHSRRPRVVWVGLDDLEGRLLPLQREIERLARARGWERERRAFRPHLTLGRVRDRARPPEGEWLASPEALSFQVEQVQLIRSQLKPAGAEYSTLHSAALARG
jgi:2'-5' RNA ligase